MMNNEMTLRCLLSLLLGGCVPAASPVPDGPAVDAHNQARAAADPIPDPPLPALIHDAALADTAQRHAERCVFEHSTNPFGENLAFFSGDDATVEDVVALWNDERQFYDAAANACTAGQQCGHYTQLVWRDTARVGCGMAMCDLFDSRGSLWVCNYDPPGNIVGERPY